MKTNTYFGTLGDVVGHVSSLLDNERVELLGPTHPDDHWTNVLTREPVNYGEAKRFDFQILTLKCKPTRKGLHVRVCRLDSGSYEVNSYIL